MELILAIIIGAILLIRIGNDKLGARVYEIKKEERRIRQKEFEAAVVDRELEQKVRDSMWSRESIDFVESVLHSIHGYENAKVNTSCTGYERAEYANLLTKILMANEGKVSLVAGSLDAMNIPIRCIITREDKYEASKQLAKWLVHRLSDHGVNVRIIRYSRPPESGFYYEWEPYYVWKNDPNIVQEIIE